MEYNFTSSAEKDIVALPKNVQIRIVEKIRFYFSHEDPVSFARRLTDCRFGDWRFRIGDYRVIFAVEDGAVFIMRIAKRDEVYE